MNKVKCTIRLNKKWTKKVYFLTWSYGESEFMKNIWVLKLNFARFCNKKGGETKNEKITELRTDLHVWSKHKDRHKTTHTVKHL